MLFLVPANGNHCHHCTEFRYVTVIKVTALSGVDCLTYTIQADSLHNTTQANSLHYAIQADSGRYTILYNAIGLGEN